MTIEQRLEFIRAGYSKADILEFEAAQDFAKADPAPADPAPADPAPADPAPADPAPADPAPAPAEHEDAPEWAAALQKSIDNLTRATQRANVLFDDMGGEVDRQTKATNAMGEYLTGKKAGKSK